MASKNGIMEQVRRNLVALISLSVAISGLAYNTWRNEASEHNRNQRLVSIQILVMLGEMQQVVLDRRHGEAVHADSARRKGWAIARTLRDISMVAEGGVPDSTKLLLDVWDSDSVALRAENQGEKASQEAQTSIQAAIDNVRQQTHDVLKNLD